MSAAGKPNSGHNNVRKHADKAKDEALDRLEKRVKLLDHLIREREENLIPLKGLPANPSQFLTDDWLPNDTSSSEHYISRSTLYKKEESYTEKLSELLLLCQKVKKPKAVAKQLKESDEEITKLTIRLNNLAELNSQIEEKYQLQIEELMSDIADLKEENERLTTLLTNRRSNVTNIFD